jgi:hypothetical protein
MEMRALVWVCPIHGSETVQVAPWSASGGGGIVNGQAGEVAGRIRHDGTAAPGGNGIYAFPGGLGDARGDRRKQQRCANSEEVLSFSLHGSFGLFMSWLYRTRSSVCTTKESDEFLEIFQISYWRYKPCALVGCMKRET